MKLIILAGGKGSRLSEYTHAVPKPLVRVNGVPIITRIINHYNSFGIKDFIIPVGYKGDMIKKYFKNFDLHNSNMKIIFNSEKKIEYEKKFNNYSFSIIDTGLETLTALRLFKIKKYIEDEIFMLTYGDGLSDVNIEELLKFHKKHGKIGTMTIVRPQGRFGEIDITDDFDIKYFKEKPKISKGWINGGFFVFNKDFFKYISDKNEMLEDHALNNLAADNQLVGFAHDGFWQCIDNPRDLEFIETTLRDMK